MNCVTRVLRIYCCANVCTRQYAIKTDLKIKWVRPEKILGYKPEKSGDLCGMPPIDRSQLCQAFQESKELVDADDNVKRLFTLEFAPRREAVKIYIDSVISRVQRHLYDTHSAEARIARMTGAIRSYQEIMEKFPRNKIMKVRLQELIDKRKKYIKRLRTWDYKRFEWLLEMLDIVYKPHPDMHSTRVTRKDSLTKLTDEYCNNIKNQRLEEYKQFLENEQPFFLEEKIRLLEFVKQEQIHCGAPVTVTDEDIESVRLQLKLLTDETSSPQQAAISSRN